MIPAAASITPIPSGPAIFSSIAQLAAAVVTAEMIGNKVERLDDVGVAGLHRLLDKLPNFNKPMLSSSRLGWKGL
jgi:pyridinium-3,5-biscarboxylic acid mononucleotide synthase